MRGYFDCELQSQAISEHAWNFCMKFAGLYSVIRNLVFETWYPVLALGVVKLFCLYVRSYTTPSSPLYSVTCTSRNTSVNPMLEIDNGAVPIPPSYIQNTSSSITLNAPRGLVESGLTGYYTCRIEGDTFFSPHLLYSSKCTAILYTLMHILVRLCL